MFLWPGKHSTPQSRESVEKATLTCFYACRITECCWGSINQKHKLNSFESCYDTQQTHLRFLASSFTAYSKRNPLRKHARKASLIPSAHPKNFSFHTRITAVLICRIFTASLGGWGGWRGEGDTKWSEFSRNKILWNKLMYFYLGKTDVFQILKFVIQVSS